ncbi:MAG: MFS transporter [Actinomycetota bacterium]
MNRRLFPGWYVVASVFVVLSATSGLIFYGLAIYLDALTDEQSFSTTSVSLATSVFFIVGGVSGRVIAPLIERHDIRIVMGAGGVLSTISLYLLGRVTTIVALYAVYVALAVGFALVGLLPGTTLVTRWFHERRAFALAVASTGLSFGGLTYTIFASWLIDDRGLEAAAPILAIVFFVSIAAAMPGLWPWPAARGLAPFGEPPASDGPADGLSYDTAVTTRFFRVMVIMFILAMGAQVGALSQVAKLGTERIDRPTGALAVSAIALGSVIGRLAGGAVADRLPLMRFTVVLALGQAVTLTGIAFADSRLALMLIAFAFGTTVGNLLMLQPLVIASAFGIAAYPRIFATQQLLVTAGVAGGPLLLGFLRDQSSYRTSYLVAAALSIVAAAIAASTGIRHPTPATITDAPHDG